MAVFLSKENFENVFETCHDFLTNHIKLDIDKQDLQKSVALEMKNVATNGSGNGAAIQELNKQVIINIRKQFTSPPPQQQVQEEPVTPTDGSEENFFKKLKNLELQRTVVAPTHAPVPSTPPSVTRVVAAPPQAQPSTVVIKELVKQGAPDIRTSTVLSSHNRLWLYQTSRSPFIISKDLPKNVDLSSLRISRVILPKIMSFPFFYLTIEGASKHRIECLLRVANMSEMYMELVADSHIQMLSMPWTITVHDNFMEPVDLGSDGWFVKHKIQTSRNTTVYVVDHENQNIATNSFQKGDVIEIHTPSDSKSRHVIVDVENDKIEIKSDGPSEGYIINVSKQFAVVLDWMEKNDAH